MRKEIFSVIHEKREGKEVSRIVFQGIFGPAVSPLLIFSDFSFLFFLRRNFLN
jgi:hypothetical protein